ncbi:MULTISPECIES: YraN family protein [unclassified Pseudoxanthomonas]|uniref:YraN family protein n=1 Tax=unclassified Pseudoxanthomonas TaxID=2645906 RepID=UPI0008ED4B49|nr:MULTISPECIES: YraN family protein [unclassified Pseudoxanthomonas]PPJ43318.1 YraN family protein [Pseudoxanthomonas sp. KAs_5_3]SFV34829.1 putative endonuclease [Pseudoxanthomonas sp. YR558]
MAADRRTDGRTAEIAARALLLKAGLTEIAANVSYRGGELDLVMLDGSATVVFVEVRYRRSRAFGGGAASVDTGKRRRLIHAALRFLQDHPKYANAPCRFDVVDADGDPAAPRLEWIRDAFRADDA